MAFFERRILTQYDASTAGFDRGTRRVEQQLARLQRAGDARLRAIDTRFERAGRAALRLGTSIGLIFGAAGAGAAVRGVRTYAEAWRDAGRQLTAAGFAIEDNRDRLAKLAIRVRGDFQTTSAAVARFARVTGDDLATSIRRVETLQKLLTIGGAQTQERQSAVLQLTQGLRSGQLGGEELRAIREAAPVEFLDALARRAGGTRAELKQLGAEGKLTAEVIKGALDDLAASADRQFAALAVSGSEAVEVLNTGFATFFGRLDEQVGATATLNQFLVDLGTFLSDDAEAAATFAKGLEVAAVAAASLAGGRALGAVTAALVEGNKARLAAVASSQAVVAAAEQEVQASLRKLRSAQLAASAARAERDAIEARRAGRVRALVAEAAAERDAAAARVTQLQADLQQNAVIQKQAAQQRARALAERELQVGLQKSGQATQALSVSTAQLNEQTRLGIRLRQEERALQAALTEAVNAEATARARASTVAAAATQRGVDTATDRAAAQKAAAAADAAVIKTNGALSKAMTDLSAAETRATAATNTLAISQGRLSAATRITTGAATALKGAWAFIGGLPGFIFAAATALVLFSDELFGAADAADRAEQALADANTTVGKLREAQQRLAGDTDALKGANERLQTAIEAQQGAAVDTARIEIDAINRRIAKNLELKATYEAIIRAQLAVAEGSLAEARTDFEREFGASRSSEVAFGILAPAASLFGTPAPSRPEDRAGRIAERRQRITAAQDAGQVLGDDDVAFLEASARLAELEDRAKTTREALEHLGDPIEVETPPASDLPSLPAGGGGGGGASAIDEQTQAVEELIAASDRRASQIIDEQELLRAKNAEERAYLEERQRLLNEAAEKGITLPPEFVEAQSRGIAELTAQLDGLRAAKEVIVGVSEEQLSTEERIVAANERLAELLPQIVLLVGDEAKAREILAEAQSRNAEEIRAAEDGTNKWADAITGAVRGVDSLDEAFNRLLNTFIELAANEFFKSLFDPGSVENGSGIFDVLGSALGSAIGGAFGGGGGSFTSFAGGSSAGLTTPLPTGTLQGFTFFDSGGFTGQGGKHEPAGVVHKGEIVWSQDDIRKAGGVAVVEAMRTGIVPGFAEGGFVSPSLPPVPIVPTVPQIAPRETARSIVIGDTTINITEPGLTQAQLQRVLAEHRQQTIAEVRRINEHDPGFLHT